MDEPRNGSDEALADEMNKAPKFELIQHLQEPYHIARDTIDGQQYIAKKLVDFDAYHESRNDHGIDPQGYMTKAQRYSKGLRELTYDHGMSRHVSFIMNHENLISFAGFLRHKPLDSKPFDDNQPTDDYLLWDFCDGGSLELLLVNKGQKPPLIGKRFLEESLCWHVLTSVMRALTWLHDGYRRSVDFDSKKHGQYRWACSDIDWDPILHRNIEGINIFFQRPKGTEHYGLCKLGDMTNVFVCNQPADRFEGPLGPEEGNLYNGLGSVISPPRRQREVAPAEATNKDRAQPSVQDMRRGMKAWAGGAKEEAIYSISDDHWALGTVLFRMMTARYLPSYHYCTFCDGCRHVSMCAHATPCTRDVAQEEGECSCDSGGCRHILEALRERTCNHPKWKSTGPCSCRRGCNVRHINIDDTLAQHDYSWLLIRAVRMLFNSWSVDRLQPARNSRDITTEIEYLYSQWRNTPEGMDYVDVEDDVRRRYAACRTRSVSSRKNLG